MASCLLSKHSWKAIHNVASVAPFRLPLSTSTVQSNWPSLSKHPSIVYADKGVVVANKPKGLICQIRHDENDELSNFLCEIQEDLKSEGTPLSVHRLDKETTGAIIFALNQRFARDLSQQMKSRTIEKTYLALVRAGSATFPGPTGTITNELAIDSEGRVNLASLPAKAGKWPETKREKRKSAMTDWEVLATSKSVPLTLLKLRLHTGVKHQLRVHMAHTLRAPILGDTLFSSSKVASVISKTVSVPEGYMYLHASELSFFRYAHTGKRQRVTVVAPLPAYFTRLCAKLSIPLSRDAVKGGVWIDGERAGNVGYFNHFEADTTRAQV